ncbi:MAG TPA: LysR family transcriptional regulator [Nitriliruptoraceae bacterium]|nr:LysR family transcriptional regulator [Nitriliruptoraceae bacterium]
MMVATRDIEIRHLMALQAVADTGTFGRAADQLGYTQSAISQQVAALERMVGEQVFDRPGGPRPVELTPLGKVLLGHANAVLERADEAANAIERFRAGTIGRIDIGNFQSALTALVPPILGRMRAERPDVDVRLVQEDDLEVLIRRVAEGQLDVSFFLAHDDPRVESVHLLTDPYVLVARADDLERTSTAMAGPASPNLLHGAPTIAELDTPCQRQIDRGLQAVGVIPDIVFRTNDNTAVTAMVRAGMGMAVLPLLAVGPSDDQLVVRPLDPPIPPRKISIGWQRGRTLSPAASRFVELAQEVTQSLQEQSLAALG